VEHLITFQPTGGMVDSEYVVFTGWDPGRDQGADRDDRGGADGIGAVDVGAEADQGRADLELRETGRVAAATDAPRLGRFGDPPGPVTNAAALTGAGQPTHINGLPSGERGGVRQGLGEQLTIPGRRPQDKDPEP
jgi:hypothetical protein